MPEQIPFVGRENEMDRVNDLINAWGTRRVLCIHGDGGVGKTRLLEEVYGLYHKKDQEIPLIVANIIDFDDRVLHVIENVERQIMQNLGAKVFETYSQKILDWYKMKMADISPTELEEQARQVRKTLVDNFNKLSSERRIVLLLDTLEKLEGTNAWERLSDLILNTKNTLFLLAGRETKELYKSLRQRLGDDVELIELGPLEVGSSQQYLEEKQRRLNIILDPEIKERLLLLAQGRPILIDLAVEWLSRNIPLEWLTADKLAADRFPSDKDIKNFRYQLVAHIGQIRSQIDRLVLLMSRVYPLDAAMIAKSLDLADDEAETLQKKAQTYIFVKSYPDGRIYLHDEMRLMIREYVWPEVDPDGGRRRNDSKLAIKHFEPQINILTKNIADQEEIARQAETAKAEFEAFVKRESLVQELWAIREQFLFHTLFIDTEEGVNIFTSIFDQATRDYQYSFREVLVRQMRGYIELAAKEDYLDTLSSLQTYEVDIRQAKYFLDNGQYQNAEALLKEMYDRSGLQADQQVDMCIQRANVVIRLGKFHESIKFFQEAVEISKKNHLAAWSVKAENGLGWAYRHIGNREQARRHYEVALKLAKKLDLKHQQALLYNNLGFIYAYIPQERDKALPYCKASLALWQEIGDKRGQGRSYSALGCVTFMTGQFDEALSYFQKALNIFEPVKDREWLSTVYSWRGAVYLSKGNFDLAEKDLHQSLAMNIQKDEPMNRSRQGLIYLVQGKLEMAQEAVDQCRRLALELNDVFCQLISLRNMTRLAYQKREYERLGEFEQLLEIYLGKWGDPQDLRALGMLYLNLGNLALGQEDMAKAVQYYERGLEPLAQLGRYGSDTLEIHIERLEKFIMTDLVLAPARIRDIGNQLQSFWQDKGYDVVHPDVWIHLNKWSNWKGT